MKRILILITSLGLVIGCVATAEAAKKTQKPIRVERTVEGSYGPLPSPAMGCNEPLGAWACMIVGTRQTEAYFTAKVADAHGQPVFVEARSFPGAELVARFCGETKRPVPIMGGHSIEFYVAVERWSVSLDCPTNRVKTIGTISVTLSNLP